MLSSWMRPRWYIVSIAPSTPPRSEIRFELLVDRGLDQVGQRLDRERALPGVLGEVEAELAVDDQLDRDGAPHRLLGRRGDRLIVGIRWRLLQLSKIAYIACSVVRMSLKLISCAWRLRPDVWT